MLSLSRIRKESGASTYLKGADVYRVKNILSFDLTENDDVDIIWAEVKGSGRHIYDVRLKYNVETDEFEETHCDCPAFSSYPGICKHCVAVLMEYIGEKDSRNNKELESKKQSFKKELKKKQLEGKLGRWGKETTPIIKGLLANQVKKKTMPIQNSDFGKVRFQGVLSIHRGTAQMDFKLGISHMYILKDIFELDRAIVENATVSYGKKLSFFHDILAFAREDRPLIEFLQQWVDRNESRFVQSRYYGYGYGYRQTSIPKSKNMPLSGGDLEQLFDVFLPSGSMIVNYEDEGEAIWKLSEEPLERTLTIQGLQGGIQLEINDFDGIQCPNSNIYFVNGTVHRISKHQLEPILDFLTCMAEIPNRKVFVAKEDVPVFFRELLPTLERHFVCTKIDFDMEQYGVLEAKYEMYLDSPDHNTVTCKIIAVYGDEKYTVYHGNNHSGSRDQVGETQVLQIVSSWCNGTNPVEELLLIEYDEDLTYDFLTEGILNLQSMGEVFVSDRLKRFNIVSSPKVSVGISLSGNIIDLKLTSEDITKEQLLEILSKYNRKKKYYRLKTGEFIQVEEGELEALYEIKQGLHLTDAQLKEESIQIPKYRALYLDSELRGKESLSTVKDKEFKALIRNMKTVEDNDFEIPPSLDHILREYQKRGFLWLKTLHYNGFCGILADDMGLGKTLQVIAFLVDELCDDQKRNKQNQNWEDSQKRKVTQKRALIVCPASLVYNWNSEIKRFAPELAAKMVVGTARERKSILEDFTHCNVLITSYDLLKRDLKQYEKMAFFCEIIDEAQYIKNYNTQAAKAVKQIQAEYKLALTGTPIENRLSELWSIFDYLMPGYLYSYTKFRDELELPISQNKNEFAIRRLQKMIQPFVLRRLKKDVLADLPDKIEENLLADMEGEQQKLYDAHVKRLQLLLDHKTDEDFNQSKIQILAELTKLRQLCCDPALLYEDFKDTSAKMELCMDLVTNAISGGHKILIFSQFTSMLERIEARLKEEYISYYLLTGATSKDKRAAMVEAFNQDKTPVFCISLKAGGTGLNLTAADIVIHFDPWWNLAVQNQATDRAHRIGQKNVVNVYRLIMKDTIEENIVKLQELKKEIADQVLSGEGIGAGSFSKEELLALIQRSE